MSELIIYHCFRKIIVDYDIKKFEILFEYYYDVIEYVEKKIDESILYFIIFMEHLDIGKKKNKYDKNIIKKSEITFSKRLRY